MNAPQSGWDARRRVALLRSIVACPACHGRLVDWRCDACDRTYAFAEGRPVLLERGDVDVPKVNAAVASQAAAREGRSRGGLGALADKVRAATTAKLYGDDRNLVPGLVDELVGTLPSASVVLDVGACEQYYRADLERLGEVVAMDIALYGATDVIGDCHRLPFADASLGAISAIEVLEHLARPGEFFAEAARTLRPGGALFGIAPQYCPTHGFPYDFFRYTRAGLATLADYAGMRLEDAWPTGGSWGTLLHWVWANHARESPLHKVKGVNLAWHAGFQALASTLDRLDARHAHGRTHHPQEHNDHRGWCFIIRR